MTRPLHHRLGETIAGVALSAWNFDVTEAACTKIWRAIQTVLLGLITTALIGGFVRLGEVVYFVQGVPAEHADIGRKMDASAEKLLALDRRVVRLEVEADWARDVLRALLNTEAHEHPGAYVGIPTAPPDVPGKP